MKRSISSFGILLFISLIIFNVQCSSTKDKEEESEYPLLETMGYYQRFSQKLWLAGQNENWELAEFYAHELHEVTEELIESNVMHDNHDLSVMAKSIIEQSIEKVDGAVDKKDQVLFREHYQLMIASCNVCHIKTGHQFIKIIIPTDSSIFNQQFSN
ncbi:MAG: hypothetical protein RIM99_02970 [Cyclobacteriaceae bacterium]